MPEAPARAGGGRLPLAYLTMAAAAFVAAAAAVPWLAPELAGHYYQPRVLALTHLVTLGWITLTIMGASYQLVPVLLARPLWSERLAWVQLAIVVVGATGMVSHFVIGDWRGLVWAAGLMALGVLVHLVNLGLSIRGLGRWTIEAAMMVFALVGLGLTILAGLALGLDHVRPFLPWPFFPRLHAHFHLALLGWVLPMVVGVASRVYPMFLLGPRPGWRLVAVQLAGLAVGVPLVVIGILGNAAVLAVGAAAMAMTVGSHLWGVVGIARARRRPQLDWALGLVLAGTAFLLPAALLGLAFVSGAAEGPRFGAAYAALALGGWASLTIAGMMLKIVPLLVWYRVYGSRAGREPVPTPVQLSSPTAERLAGMLLIAGVTAVSGALFVGDADGIRLAGLILAAGATAFAVALAHVLLHLRSPRSRSVAPGVGRARPRAGR
jgi:hypothetical protein